MKKRNGKNTAVIILFALGFVLCALALGLGNPVASLVCLGAGLGCAVPGVVTGLKGNKNVTECVSGGALVGLYAVLVVMKDLRGFGREIPDWLAFLWAGLAICAGVAFAVGEFAKQAKNKGKKKAPKPEPKPEVKTLFLETLSALSETER